MTHSLKSMHSKEESLGLTRPQTSDCSLHLWNNSLIISFKGFEWFLNNSNSISMSKKCAAFFLATALAVLPLVSAVAADKSTNAAPETPASKSTAKPAVKKTVEKTVSISGKVTAVDLILKTVTLEKGKKQTVYQVTSETRFHAGDKPETMRGITTGETVEGRASALGDGKYDLKALYMKAKPKEAAPAKAVEKKADVKAPAPSATTNAGPVAPAKPATPPKP
jgi:hypothetical protein